MRLTPLFGAAGFLLSLQVNAEITTYPWPASSPESTKYSVKLFQDCEQFDPKTLYSAPVLESGPDEGNGVTGIIQDRSMSYVPFAYTGEIIVEAKKLYGTSASRVEITPFSYGITPDYFDGTTVRFTMPDNLNPAYISVNFVSDDNLDPGNYGAMTVKNGLMLFADKPEVNAPDLNQPGVVDFTQASSREEIENADLLYFPAGDHYLATKLPKVNNQTGTDARIYLKKNGQQIYLAPGAYVRGSIEANGKDNITVKGRGVFSGEDFYWHYFRTPSDGRKIGFFNFMGSDDVTFDGFIIANPTHHTMPSSNRTHIKNVKIIGWASNHDGVRPASDSLVEQVFIKTSDDLDYARDPHLFKDSVIWPMRNGAFGMLGWNDLGIGYAEYENIRFIHTEWDNPSNTKRNTGIIGSVLNQGINLTQNRVENIYGEWGTGMLANISIEYATDHDMKVPDPIIGWGKLSHFTFKNILLESKFQNLGGNLIKNQIKGFEKNGAKATISDFNFINVIAGDTIVTNDNAHQFFDIDPNTTSNINFYTEGDIYTVSTQANSGGRLSPAGHLPTPEGMDRYVHIIPDVGYKIADVKVDGVSVGAKQLVLIPAVTANHSVEVSFVAGEHLFGEELSCSTDTNAQPILMFRAPANNTEYPVGSLVTLYADAMDTDGYIKQVEFYQNGQLIGVDYRRPYLARINSLEEGKHVILAVAEDDLGKKTSVELNIQTPMPLVLNDITDLSVANVGCGAMQLSWSDVSDAEFYRIRRRLSTESTYQILADVAPGIQYFEDTSPLVDGQTYVYMVRPMAEGITAALSNTASIINQCQVAQEPVDISDLTVTNSQCGVMALTWTDVPAADKYRVRRKLSTDSTYINIGDVDPGVGSFTDNSNLAANQTYIYMVRPMLDGKAVKLSNTPSTLNMCP